MPCPSPPAVGTEAPRAAEHITATYVGLAVVSHGQYVLTLTVAAA